jgi:hypothetical protein
LLTARGDQKYYAAAAEKERTVGHAALRHPEIMKMALGRRYHDASGLISDRRSLVDWCVVPAERNLEHEVTLDPRQDAA